MDGDLDLDLDLAAAISLASLTSNKGKPRASRKAAAPKPKKVLTAEQRAKESVKRKDRRHAAGARDEAIAAAAAQQHAFKVQHNGKCFNLSHCFRMIKDEEKFKTQYAGLKSRGGKQAVEEVGDGEKARTRGKTNSKKEGKWDAASIALITTVEGMITKKDSREEKRRQEREEQINVFLKIQRRRFDMEAEKQARMLEMEAEKQAKMLEI
ncbi:C2 domain-containing protein [Hordeum vulgare]|nr:C2 domain-containing protein [Hordeum vulgare]